MQRKTQNTAVVAVSGGLDSCVTAAIATQKYNLAFAHFNYGQKTESKELQAFNNLADHFNVKRKLVVDFNHFKLIGGSALTDDRIHIAKADLSNEKVPATYVPFRNANMISACVSWAEVIGAGAVFMGAVYEDSSGYPDCRPEFFSAFEKAIERGTKPETRIIIETPIIQLSKSEIVEKGIELNAPLHLTWSCYQNEDLACGICDSCALRLRGFQQAGVEDPINYRVKPNYV